MSMRSERSATIPFLYTLVGGASVDVRKMRTGIVNVIAILCALSFFWHDSRIVSLEAALFGGLVATFLFEPLRSLPLPSRSAKALGGAAALTSLVSLYFIAGTSTEPVDLLYRFVAGATLYGSVILADRLRAPSKSL